MLELTLRLVFSLAVVVGLLLLLARLGARRFKGGADALVRVVHRQPLSRTTAVAVVTVGSRVLVLGTTEHQVTVLTELDPEELVGEELADAEDDGAAGPAGTAYAAPGDAAPAGGARRLEPQVAPETTPLGGSVLSPATWRQALAALQDRGREGRDDRGRHRP
ncbi:flagellar biosynthetic protein FliO [Nocardioides solisilvae]|uniref:flagellar biosynthetic protein FliO n=1 Tax=Nocardioides solisilvae TaxID=1542435 RepID=UPI000D748288|nr:flagellar biosynthetic protein FliO [Nocardioides solisilvae]